MKRLGWIISLLLISGPVRGVGVPQVINYQGTLKQAGIPAVGTHNMSFRLTDFSKSATYGSVVNVSNVSVNQGLFAVQLDFTANGTTPVDWQNIQPYIQVSIDGQAFDQVEPLNSTAYAFMSASVVDGSITAAKLDSSVTGITIPKGMIAMFASACPPTGWAPFTALQGKFPVGAGTGTDSNNNSATFTAGQAGGYYTHNHGGFVRQMDLNNNEGGQGGYCSRFSMSGYGGGCGGIGTDVTHRHVVNTDSSLPSYKAVVFCEKL